MSDASNQAPEVEFCCYCGAGVEPHDSVPAIDDDSTWDLRSEDHHPGCEWIATRAHRTDGAPCSVAL